MTIFGLPVGEGILALSPIPGVDGDYAGDLQHIVEWKPAVVMSLVTEVELVAAGAAGLWRDLAAAGTRWEHMPISDFGVPDDAFEEAWPDLSKTARAALSGGGRVLVHCRGGCGRSGMVVLRLMIEMGDAPGDAFRRLRAVRPCAVETEEQKSWAFAGKRAPALFLRHAEG